MRRSTASWCGIGSLTLLLVLGAGRADAPKPTEKERPTNRLAHESSPYLLLHAHNPVDWYPWGPEAFARAKKDGKLIFLSIGYSSCYWCHVMERESFANAEVAKLLNQWFVCIKVDREERPNVDHVYMTALSVIGRSGGWPMSMFLTADGKPIDGGTYFPREDRVEDGEKYLGFKSILARMHDLQSTKPKLLLDHADKVADATARALEGTVRGLALVELDRELVDGVVDSLKKEYDKTHGGFGRPQRNFTGPKFPMPPYLLFLLQEARAKRGQTPLPERARADDILPMLETTLDRMAQGGIYDQIGGGFHRYSTERTWTVPHFEKMLYDNAQLVEVYARAYRLTKKPLYRRVVQETLAFVKREMTSPDGAFYSAIDAETKGEEGRFYVWTGKEIDTALQNEADAAFLKKIYGADGELNFESKYHILYLQRPLAETARKMKLSEEELLARLAPIRQKLLDARGRRPRPLIDTKVLTSWNGQMIAGYAVAGQMLDEPGYIAAAGRAADFLLKNLRTREGRLLRTYGAAPGQKPAARLNGYLDDYAFLTHGLLCLHDATGEKRWLDAAKALTDTMLDWYADKNGAAFYYTANDHEKFFARAKDDHDGVQPSGNSAAALNLVRLGIKTGDRRYRTLGEKTMKAFAGPLKAYPSSLTTMALAVAVALDAQKEPAKEPAGDPKPAQPAKATQSAGKVKVNAKATKPDADGAQVVTVTIDIDKGWHLYANPLPKDFPGVPLTITIEADKKPEEVKVNYPAGKTVKDVMVGDYNVYEDQVVVKVNVRRAKGDTGPVKVKAVVQTCSKSKCLQQSTVEVSVP